MTRKLTIAIFGEWPLVHNSSMLGEAGYDFVGFDIASGTETLQHALNRHDQKHASYEAKVARLLLTVNPIMRMSSTAISPQSG